MLSPSLGAPCPLEIWLTRSKHWLHGPVRQIPCFLPGPILTSSRSSSSYYVFVLCSRGGSGFFIRLTRCPVTYVLWFVCTFYEDVRRLGLRAEVRDRVRAVVCNAADLVLSRLPFPRVTSEALLLLYVKIFIKIYIKITLLRSYTLPEALSQLNMVPTLRPTLVKNFL